MHTRWLVPVSFLLLSTVGCLDAEVTEADLGTEEHAISATFDAARAGDGRHDQLFGPGTHYASLGQFGAVGTDIKKVALGSKVRVRLCPDDTSHAVACEEFTNTHQTRSRTFDVTMPHVGRIEVSPILTAFPEGRYAGTPKVFEVGTYRADRGEFTDNELRSFHFNAAIRGRVCEHPDGSGTCRELMGSVLDLVNSSFERDRMLASQVSYIEVRPIVATMISSELVSFGQEFGTARITTEPSSVRSVFVGPGALVRLCSTPTGGTCAETLRSLATLPSGVSGQVRRIEIAFLGISYPHHGTVLRAGTTVTFEGFGEDPVRGRNVLLTWSSQRLGLLGHGERVTVTLPTNTSCSRVTDIIRLQGNPGGIDRLYTLPIYIQGTGC